MRSLYDVAINILFNNRSPSSDELDVIKSKIGDISLRKLSKILLDYRLNGQGDRFLLIKKLHIKTELPESEGLWDDLVFCGSGLTPSLFDNVEKEGYCYHKLLKGTYSEEFIELFDYLWKRDKVLRILEWKHLKIGKIYHRDAIIYEMNDKMINTIKKHNLINIIEHSSDEMVYGISKSLVYRSRGLDNYENFKDWIKKDPIHASVILANSLDHKGNYNKKKLETRYENRVRSDRKLFKFIRS